jgi:prepilin-type N-terminal cleavage/methylation domain-containing protein
MRQRGFTLVELMIVVAIIGVLAVVAVTTFRKYSDSGRAAEAMAMIGEFKTKEEAYKAEYNTYLSTDSSETALYPVLTTGCPSGQHEPCPKSMPAKPWASAPLSNWQTLGIAPTRGQLYCGYVAIAGTSAGWGNAGPNGKNIFSNATPTAPNWFYVYAECDNNWKLSGNTTYVSAFNQSTVFTKNEHQ